MKVSELLEKLIGMPQDAFVVAGVKGAYTDIADVEHKMSIVKEDDIRRYELGIIAGEDILCTPVVTLDLSEYLTVIDPVTEQFA